MSKLKKLKVKSKEEIAKRYGSRMRVAADVAEELETIPRIPSRCLWLNHKLGGGLPYGRVTELFGFESTGKTLLALDFGYATQQLGGVVLWADGERQFDYHWAQKNGLDLAKLVVLESNAIEIMSDWAKDTAMYWRSKLTNNEPILFVCDSIASMESQAKINGDMEDGKAAMGNRAKAFDEFYRLRNDMFVSLGITVIMINQVRNKLNTSMFESNETTPGGNATKFYASVRIALNKGAQIKGRLNNGKWVDDKTNDKSRKIGQTVYVGIPKNKTFPPANNTKTEVYFLDTKSGYTGFDRYSELLDILLDEGVVTKKGTRYYYKDKEICNGQDNFTQALIDRPVMRKNIINKSSIATISKAASRLAELKSNLFDVNDFLNN